MIVPELQPPYVAPLLAAHPMRVLQFPKLEGLLNGQALHYPYRKTFQEGFNDPLLSVHTSGTTGKCDNPNILSFGCYLLNLCDEGFPKPRTITLGCAVTMANVYNSPATDGVKHVTSLFLDQFLLSAMPMFHVSIHQ